ncbi:hypothetical protein BGW80DRAFT_1345518 [Lactifluus volemus]|nr:hypothetical protein BGW80DRAFT_1345518 [Lactifluus volemus]
MRGHLLLHKVLLFPPDSQLRGCSLFLFHFILSGRIRLGPLCVTSTSAHRMGQCSSETCWMTGRKGVTTERC